jgi:16S rRNA (adenine1518-N6/adenine1519-N6)-dimethyltransferase
MKLSDMKQVLVERKWMLTKSLGQNFLHDQNQIRRIVDAAEVGPSDNVLEVGPGLGPLTELLLERSGHVLAVETDGRMVEFLRERFSDPKLDLRHGDALALARESHDWSDWKLVANLPYCVASPILVELAQSARRPRIMVVTLQLEVAQRLMAEADDDHYGVLTLLMQLHYVPRGQFKIPRTCFFPEPDVDSLCIALERRATPLLPEERRALFVKIVKRAFSQRRKMMMKLLKQDWAADKLAEIFARLQIPVQERAEKLSLEQFVALTNALADE